MEATPVPKGYNQNYSGVKVLVHHGGKMPFAFLKRKKSGGPKVAHWWVIFRISRPHCWKQLAEPWIPYANRLYRPVWLIYFQLLAAFGDLLLGFAVNIQDRTISNCTISPARYSSNSGLCFCRISPPGSLNSKVIRKYSYIFLSSGFGICEPFPAGSPVCTERV